LGEPEIIGKIEENSSTGFRITFTDEPGLIYG
jgi:hypothetical protein